MKTNKTVKVTHLTNRKIDKLQARLQKSEINIVTKGGTIDYAIELALEETN